VGKFSWSPVRAWNHAVPAGKLSWSPVRAWNHAVLAGKSRRPNNLTPSRLPFVVDTLTANRAYALSCARGRQIHQSSKTRPFSCMHAWARARLAADDSKRNCAVKWSPVSRNDFDASIDRFSKSSGGSIASLASIVPASRSTVCRL
jgi:hypothetical protein